MSYRNLFFALRGTERKLNHRFRKFQKSKLPSYVETKRPTIKKMIEVEVPLDDK